MLSQKEVVEKAIRMFPQFRNVASSDSQIETSWLHDVFTTHICFTLFIQFSKQITKLAANFWAQNRMPDMTRNTL